MSDSEDDFMSDKFLVESAPKASSSSSTYSQRRNVQQLKSMRAGQANNKLSSKQMEEQRRKEGLNTSLFDRVAQDQPHRANASSSNSNGSGAGSSGAGLGSKKSSTADSGGVGGGSGGGGPKAMELMMKMGWKVGEGLGRKRSASPPSQTDLKRAKQGFDPDGASGEPSSSNQAGASISTARTQGQGRTEPIRVSLWAGRKGLTARSPSPPPLPVNHLNPDVLDERKMARLTSETEDFRARQRKVFGEKEVERKENRAREMLMEFDREKGVKFHPLHILPSDPLGTIPRPLLQLIYPAQVLSPSPSRSVSPDQLVIHEKEENLSVAAKMREQIRRDMLSDIGDDEDDDDFASGGTRLRSTTNSLLGGRPSSNRDEPSNGSGLASKKAEQEHEGVDWESHVSGTKKVLAMDPSSHLEFLLSQLRHEHYFCFWCAYKYSSYDEMEAPGGCPGEDEDDH